MTKHLRVRERDGWTTKNEPLTAAEVDDNFLALWDEIQALKNGGGTEPVEDGVPDTFGSNYWSVEPTGLEGEVEVTVSTLPNAQPAITGIEYSLDEGGAESAGISGTGSFIITGLTDDQEYEVRLRAVNGEGAGDWSASKLVTPGGESEPSEPSTAELPEDIANIDWRFAFWADAIDQENGTAVEQWDDLSGNGHHATVPDDEGYDFGPPVLNKNSDLNGRAAVEFGSGALFVSPGEMTRGFSMFVVLKAYNHSPHNAERIMEGGVPTFWNMGGDLNGWSVGSVNFADAPNEDYLIVTAGRNTADGDWIVERNVRINTLEHEILEDSDNPFGQSSSTRSNFYMGSTEENHRHFNGQIAFLAWKKGDFSLDEIDAMVAWAESYYGFTSEWKN
ncbi:fibronectin type III domain-containing protein [Halorhodospira sp. 9621]|uniref:fibronectin type III domain-containing protein n=1 Tax=Halorhodospira sp. 9621 TaxID=2899135 RepID=UPI001EE9A9B3|nr:fibronectin type III domain-containing protein [Halorhodospira sp. 9621]MCG5533103.1 fibronectin type III domain-containing protein [Halorhodospira sp. 9621]